MARVTLGERQQAEEELQELASDQGSTLASPSCLLASSDFQQSYFVSFFFVSCRWDLVPDQKAHVVEAVGGRVLAPERDNVLRRCVAQCSRTRL